MKKLLFITPGFPKDITDSHVIPFLQQVFLSFKRKYPEVELTIITIHKPIGKPYFWNKIQVIPLNGNDVKYPMKLGFLAKSFFKIYQLHQKNKYDGILNCWFHEFSVFMPLIHPKNYTWLLGQDVKKSNWSLRLFKPNPEKIMALSHYNNAILYETAKIRAHKIIPMAIDESIFPEINLRERPIDIFGAGWFSGLKNYTLFLAVILEVRKIKPDIKVEIAGAGEQENELINFVKANNLFKNVAFLGLLTHQETINKMNRSKIFLHTSTFEGGSTVYFESLYSGCQLVGTLPMMDKPVENFYYCPTEAEIVATISYLLANLKPPKRVSYYSMDFVCEEIYNLFYP